MNLCFKRQHHRWRKLLFAGVVALFGVGSVHAQSLVIPDTGGYDQIDQGMGAQQDIAGVGITGNTVEFAWDETDLSGANSSDVCNYYLEPDDNVTAICYSVQFEDDGSIVSGFPEYTVYDCGTTYGNGKCTGNNPESTDYTAVCTAPVLVDPYFPEDPDQDLQGSCTISGLGGADAGDLLYLNTCTKPSASPSSLSNDCIFSQDEDTGFLKLEKIVQDGDAVPTDFTLTATSSNGNLTGNGMTDLTPVTAGDYTLTESSGLLDDGTYELVGIMCTDDDGADVPVNSGIITLAALAQVTCTYTNKVAFVPAPSLTIEKTVDIGAITAPGTLTYTITVVNTGNQDLTNVSLGDSLSNGTTLTPAGPAGDGDGDSELDVGETWIYTATYDATQADINSGDDLVNTASVDTDQTEPLEDDAITTITSTPSLTITKDVDTAVLTAPGTLTYTIVVDNTGNVDLTGVSLTDSLSNGTTLTATGPTGDTDGDNVLDVDETWEYEATYAATQADINAGDALVNTASVDTDQTEPLEDDATTTIDQDPMLTIVKDVDIDEVDGPATLTYTITVDNTGNVDLTNVSLGDSLNGATLATTGPTGDNGDGVLATDEVWVYTATYAVTQEDINAGADLVNVASVNTDQTDPMDDDATTTIDQNPSLTIVKEVDVLEVDAPGTLNYTIVVDNTGNVDLTGVSFGDALNGNALTTVTGPAGDADGDGALDVTETWTYTATYEVSQDDIDAGTDLVNVATVDTDQTGPSEDDATTEIVQLPDAIVGKSADISEVAAAGTVINYEVSVDNTGNVTLDAATLTDQINDTINVGLSYSAGDTDGDGKIDVDEVWIYAGSYTVTQADMDAGVQLDNVACISDVDGSGAQEADECGDATTTITQLPDHTLVKDFVEDAVEIGNDGSFTLTYTNTGNVTLSAVEIEDQVATILGVNTVSIADTGTCDPASQAVSCTVDSLAPGESVVVTVGYTAAASLPMTNQTSGASYVFYFENGYVLTGSTADGTATLTAPDGTTSPANVQGANQDVEFFAPDGQVFTMHLSCSEPFINGYGITGPTEADNPEWQISSYSVDRYNSQGFLKSCGQTFTPLFADNTASAQATPAGGTLTPNPIEASDSVELIQVSSIEVSRTRVRRGNVEIQYFNTSEEPVEIDIIGITWTDGAVLESASYQDGTDLGLSGGSPQTADIDNTLGARSKDWLRLDFDPDGAPEGLVITIVTTDGATLTYTF